MADIQVDLDMLSQTATSLTTLVNDFSNAAKIVSAADIGDPTIDKALHNFTSDWKVKVGDLITSMNAVQSMASQGVSGYTTTDDQLAQSLQQSGSGSSQTS